MKTKKQNLIAIAIATIYGLTSCGDAGTGNDTATQDGSDQADPGKHVHDGTEDHVHADGPETGALVAGPNRGRVFESIDPHAEFFVKPDRTVQITFVDDDIKPIPAGEQTVTIIAGDRLNPTHLAFAKVGDVLVSDKALPTGNDFPVVLQMKATPSAELVREKFNLDLNTCPDCNNQEYASVQCGHH